MEQIGYSLVSAQGQEIEFWGDTAGRMEGLPGIVRWPSGDVTHCPETGMTNKGAKIVQRLLYVGSPSSIVFDGTKVVVTRPAPAGPEPGTVPPRLVASALNIQVANGDVASLAGAFNLGGAIYLGVGQYMLLFLAPQPDADYFPLVTGSAPNFTIAEKATDYLIVHAMTDSPGVSIDPASFSVQVFRSES